MSFNPVGGSSPRDPFKKPFRVDPTEEEKQVQEEDEKKEKKKSKKNLKEGSFLLQMLQKTIDFFLEFPGKLKSNEKNTKEHLLTLKKYFEILQKEDRSQDVQFLNELSKIWPLILEDALHFQQGAAADSFKKLLKKMQQYPAHQTHTLGYYLVEYAGQKWIPFPYMELIQKMHTEHQKNPKESVLKDLVDHIDQLIVLLKVR
jgi:hypothetical protein